MLHIFFFGEGAKSLSTLHKRAFRLENICSFISSQDQFVNSSKPLFLLVQLDEYTTIKPAILKSILADLAIQMKNFSSKVFIFPILSGTDANFAYETIQPAHLTPRSIHLPPLSSKEFKELSENELKKIDRVDISIHPAFEKILSSLGGIPRYMEVFFTNHCRYTK